jgi:hypothetical protein
MRALILAGVIALAFSSGAQAKSCRDATTGKFIKCSPAAVAPTPPPAGATALCKDNTYSMSKHHSGACSHHHGVDKWLAK